MYFGFRDGHKYSQSEIGSMFGMSRSYVNYLIKKELEKLKIYIILDENQINKKEVKEKNKINKKKRRKKVVVKN